MLNVAVKELLLATPWSSTVIKRQAIMSNELKYSYTYPSTYTVYKKRKTIQEKKKARSRVEKASDSKRKSPAEETPTQTRSHNQNKQTGRAGSLDRGAVIHTSLKTIKEPQSSILTESARRPGSGQPCASEHNRPLQQVNCLFTRDCVRVRYWGLRCCTDGLV